MSLRKHFTPPHQKCPMSKLLSTYNLLRPGCCPKYFTCFTRVHLYILGTWCTRAKVSYSLQLRQLYQPPTTTKATCRPYPRCQLQHTAYAVSYPSASIVLHAVTCFICFFSHFSCCIYHISYVAFLASLSNQNMISLFRNRRTFCECIFLLPQNKRKSLLEVGMTHKEQVKENM